MIWKRYKHLWIHQKCESGTKRTTALIMFIQWNVWIQAVSKILIILRGMLIVHRKLTLTNVSDLGAGYCWHLALIAKGDKKFSETVKNPKIGKKRRLSGMEPKAIQLRLEPAKGISTAHVLTDRWKSTPKQPKTQTLLCACYEQNRNVLVKNRGRHNWTDDGGLDRSWEYLCRFLSLVTNSPLLHFGLFDHSHIFQLWCKWNRKPIQRRNLCTDQCRVD